mmetsp:Transcript_15135/g.34884  ORF Transcript_15135/g.34884 Transcript_15135/m.34884 type:complete len:130 (+) Transcript_15135:741-1130(+)
MTECENPPPRIEAEDEDKVDVEVDAQDVGGSFQGRPNAVAGWTRKPKTDGIGLEADDDDDDKSALELAVSTRGDDRNCDCDCNCDCNCDCGTIRFGARVGLWECLPRDAAAAAAAASAFAAAASSSSRA